MASSALRTGCALLLSLGLVALFPFDALARGGRGYSSGHSADSSGAATEARSNARVARGTATGGSSAIRKQSRISNGPTPSPQAATTVN